MGGVTKASARERLLAAADDLFYRDGVRTVGIDRIIEQAGVAKASLYNTFGSKDELIHAYLSERHARYSALVDGAVTRHTDPRRRLLAVFDALEAFCANPGYRGCAFARAHAEAHPGDAADRATATYWAWLRGLFTELATATDAADPATLASQLHQLHDGAAQFARTDREPTAVTTARTAAETLIDAACTRGGPTASR